ncbi:hypothetical protein [Kitasatospora sp. NPDC094011]|uniref:hypothetical protein n=1 Tax=Kitasatospora sp. NPDC094011 TaxID=3364090 RepID=UPI003825CDFD
MPKRRTRRAAVVGILAAIGLSVGIGLTAGTPAGPRPTSVADTIWGVAPPQPGPAPTATALPASTATLDDTIWG